MNKIYFLNRNKLYKVTNKTYHYLTVEMDNSRDFAKDPSEIFFFKRIKNDISSVIYLLSKLPRDVSPFRMVCTSSPPRFEYEGNPICQFT